MKQEAEADTRVIVEVVKKMEEKNVGTKGKSFKQGLTSANDRTIELPEGRDSPFHGLDYLTNLYSLIYGSLAPTIIICILFRCNEALPN